MNIEDLFRSLSYGELSNLSLAVEGTGTIVEEKQPAIIHHANEALTRLYTRFVLKEKTVLLELVGHITSYALEERFAQSRAPVDGVPHPYIVDSADDPFIADVVKVYAAYDNDGCQLPLNDEEHPLSLFTPQAAVVQVPNAKTGAMLSLAYQALHPKLKLEDGPGIELPVVLQEALTAYIAYKVFSNMSTPEAGAKALEHLSRYDSVCQEAIDRDMVNSSISLTNTRFAKRGWV